MRKRTVKCPITNFNNISKILLALRNNSPLKKEKISEIIELSKTTIDNAAPIMNDMGLILQKRSGIDLTPDGKQLANDIFNGDKEKIKQLSKEKLLPKSKILTEAYNILISEPDTNLDNLGISLNKKLEATKWLNEKTYQQVGRTCRLILDGLQLIEYKEKKQGGRYREHRGQLKDKIVPYATTERIFELIEKSDDNNILVIKNSNLTPSQNSRIIQFSNNLIDLGIAEYIDHKNPTIKLTNDGIELKNTKDEQNKKTIFQNILLKNTSILNVISIINTQYNNKSIGYKEIGNILQNFNKVILKGNTKKGYAIILLNWLREANILEPDEESGKYYLSTSFLNKYKESKRVITDTYEFKINVVDVEKTIGEIHRLCNRILHSEDNEWYNNIAIKEKISSDIGLLIDIYKSKGQSVRTLIHMRHFIEAGYELKRIKYIENCVQLLVDDIE